MIFRQIAEIKDGRKTQTRRVCKFGEHGYADKNVNGIAKVVKYIPDGMKEFNGNPVHHYRHMSLYAVGKMYAIVPKRGQKAIADGRIEITGIRRERLQDISEADAQAEGVADVAAYRALWESINTAPGVRWEDNPLVWVYTFRFVPALVQVELF